MISKSDTQTHINNVNKLIKEANEDKLKPNSESTKTRYDKSEIFGAVNQLSSDNKELQNKLNEKGESNMDAKDMKLFENDLEKLLDEKFNAKFSSLESDLNDIKESTEKTCTSGDCFADKLDDLAKKFDEIDDVKTKVFDLKLDVNEKMKGVTDSISQMGEKLDNTCTGIDCMNKRFAEEDDMVQCPNKDCGHWFSLSANTVGDTIVCPNCHAISTLD